MSHYLERLVRPQGMDAYSAEVRRLTAEGRAPQMALTVVTLASTVEREGEQTA